MVHMLIEKEWYLLKSSQLKFTSSSYNKDNYRKHYHTKDDTSINIVELETQDKAQDKKSVKDLYPLLVSRNHMFEDCLKIGIIKRVQGKEYGPNDANQLCIRRVYFANFIKLRDIIP